jgi:hypothetical protein
MSSYEEARSRGQGAARLPVRTIVTPRMLTGGDGIRNDVVARSSVASIQFDAAGVGAAASSAASVVERGQQL